VKITVVGAGMVGSTTALRLLEGQLAGELVLVDVLEGLAKAVALDLCQAAPLRGHTVQVTGGADYGPAEGSNLVIVTAGVPRKPGQSRADLLGTNAEIVRGVCEEVRRRAPEAVLIVVSNPLDEMTTLAHRVTGFPAQRVVGMAGALDTARFRYFVAAELRASPQQVDALVLGSHGETMVPLPRLARVSGLPLPGLLPSERIAALVARTRDAGAEILSLLPQGSAWLAPSAAVADMAGAIVRDEHRVVSACALVEGQYGISGVFLGVPVRLGRGGVEEIVEVALDPDELAALKRAAETVRSRAGDLDAAEAASSGTSAIGLAPPRQDGLGGLRRESRVRRAAEHVLWRRGHPPAAGEIESLTEAVLLRLERPS
jgi:malate dehydrogenase